MEKTGTLYEDSESYYSKAGNYKKFSEAQDALMKIPRFLKPRLKGKVVLDIGCGNGKYATLLAKVSKEYIGIDISKPQLLLAQKKNKNLKNVKFICCSAENIPLHSKSVDVVLSTWGALSTIKSLRRKAKVLKEAERILKIGGNIYSVENDSKGEWAEIRKHPKSSEKSHTWLLKKGFKIVKKLNIQFGFSSQEVAKNVMHSIYGNKVSKRINKKTIRHRVLIFNKINNLENSA